MQIDRRHLKWLSSICCVIRCGSVTNMSPYRQRLEEGVDPDEAWEQSKDGIDENSRYGTWRADYFLSKPADNGHFCHANEIRSATTAWQISQSHLFHQVPTQLCCYKLNAVPLSSSCFVTSIMSCELSASHIRLRCFKLLLDMKGTQQSLHVGCSSTAQTGVTPRKWLLLQGSAAGTGKCCDQSTALPVQARRGGDIYVCSRCCGPASPAHAGMSISISTGHSLMQQISKAALHSMYTLMGVMLSVVIAQTGFWHKKGVLRNRMCQS